MSLITATTSASSLPCSDASMIAWRLEPLPEARTPSLSFKLPFFIYYGPVAFSDLAYNVRFFAELLQLSESIVSLFVRQYHHHTDTHVEIPVHLISFDIAPFFYQVEYCMGIPSAWIEDCICPFGQDPWDILCQSAAGNVSYSLNVKVLHDMEYRLHIDPCRYQELFTYGLAQYVHLVSDFESHFIEDDLSCKRIAVAVES